MMTSIRIAHKTLALAGALVALATAGAPAAHAQSVAVRPPDNFQASGADIAGWTWLRADGNFAEWTFSPNQKAPRQVCINFTLLVTNAANGGSGQNASINAQIIGPDNRPQRMKLELENPFRPRVSSDTGGVGYTAYGALCPRNATQLFSQGFRVRLEWPTQNRYHVAVRRQGAELAYTQ